MIGVISMMEVIIVISLIDFFFLKVFCMVM